ncbi:hypothetical protein GGX14DRAFT_384188 [Mycena pura]|uniref:Uncharacterized protein n=1 Tax=Mycena pura TaxID=153505 RepID=A0AAD6YV79_9AGAR|nr:hypothetical protein GGX14DRAFT_384188 [Mycena pura]
MAHKHPLDHGMRMTVAAGGKTGPGVINNELEQLKGQHRHSENGETQTGLCNHQSQRGPVPNSPTSPHSSSTSDATRYRTPSISNMTEGPQECRNIAETLIHAISQDEIYRATEQSKAMEAERSPLVSAIAAKLCASIPLLDALRNKDHHLDSASNAEQRRLVQLIRAVETSMGEVALSELSFASMIFMQELDMFESTSPHDYSELEIAKRTLRSLENSALGDHSIQQFYMAIRHRIGGAMWFLEYQHFNTASLLPLFGSLGTHVPEFPDLDADGPSDTLTKLLNEHAVSVEVRADAAGRAALVNKVAEMARITNIHLLREVVENLIPKFLTRILSAADLLAQCIQAVSDMEELKNGIAIQSRFLRLLYQVTAAYVSVGNPLACALVPFSVITAAQANLASLRDNLSFYNLDQTTKACEGAKQDFEDGVKMSTYHDSSLSGSGSDSEKDPVRLVWRRRCREHVADGMHLLQTSTQTTSSISSLRELQFEVVGRWAEMLLKRNEHQLDHICYRRSSSTSAAGTNSGLTKSPVTSPVDDLNPFTCSSDLSHNCTDGLFKSATRTSYCYKVSCHAARSQSPGYLAGYYHWHLVEAVEAAEHDRYPEPTRQWEGLGGVGGYAREQVVDVVWRSLTNTDSDSRLTKAQYAIATQVNIITSLANTFLPGCGAAWGLHPVARASITGCSFWASHYSR